MKINRLNRRMFLQGSGNFLMSIPFLHSMLPREAWGQAPVPVKRYFGMISNFNVGHHRNLLPKLSALSQSFPIPGSPHRATYDTLAKLMEGRAQLSPILNSSLNKFHNQMLLYKGLDLPTHGFHDVAGLIGNLGAMNAFINPAEPKHTETIDRFISKHAKFDPSRREAVHLGPSGPVSFQRNAIGEIVKVPSLGLRPIDIYNLLFNKGAYPESGGPALIHPRRDVLTRVLEDYNRIRNGRQISSLDKQTLESAMDRISTMQTGLRIEAIASCKHKVQDASPEGNKVTMFDQKLALQNYVHLAQSIFLCDIARVVTVNFSISDLYDVSGSPTKDYHGNITHNTGGVYNDVPNWQFMATPYSQLVSNFLAPLLESMNSFIDSANGKSFLHNGLVHYGTESVYAHRQVSLPTVTFGSLNGALKPGYMINYTDYAPERVFTFNGGTVNGDSYWSDGDLARKDEQNDKSTWDGPGLPYQRFLVTLLQAFGLQPEDYESHEAHNAHMVGRTDSLYGEHNNGISHMGGWGHVSHFPGSADDYHYKGRMKRYNFHYYKSKLPMPE